MRHGHIDDDALAFAIFTRDGKMVLNDGENGEDIQWHSQREGFSDGYLRGDDDEWRFLWLTTADGRHRIAVGQSGIIAAKWRWTLSPRSSLRGWSPCR